MLRPGLHLLALAFVIAYFLGFAAGGLGAYFTGDDAMNLVHLHGYFTASLTEVIGDALAVVTPEYRPVGGVFYRGLFDLFGLDPLPFRMAAFLLLGLNLVLAFRLIRSLSGSREVALLGALLLSYHAAFTDLYYSTGTVYDILCFAFFVSGLLVYIGGQGWRRGVLTVVFYAGALGSKEMAVTFPAALVAYELVYRWRKWERERLALIGLLGAWTAAYLYVKLGAGSDLSENALYRPSYTIEAALKALVHYANELFYAEALFNAAMVLALAALAGVVAIVAGSKTMRFGLLFAGIALLPVVFIPPRGGFVLYLPMVGLAAFTGALIARLRKWLTGLTGPSERISVASQVFVFLGLAALLLPFHLRARERYVRPVESLQGATRAIVDGMKRLRPELPGGTRILFLDDPYPEEDWILLFLTRLSYDDSSIVVERAKSGVEEEAGSYDLIFTYADGQLRAVPKELLPSAAETGERVAVVFTPPEIRAGEEYAVEIFGYANSTVDVVFRQVRPSGNISGVARGWQRLDEKGRAVNRVPADFDPAVVEIRRIRRQGGGWTPAEGTLTITKP